METQSITLTESASLRILNVLKDTTNSKFRVYVTGGGCSGFQYGFKFDNDEAFNLHKHNYYRWHRVVSKTKYK